jgi:alpha-tubulin suppressor-like RCC1 family protein
VQTSAGGTNWKQISCGNNQTGAIKTDGTLWVWGYNASGQLGINSTTPASTPVQTIAGGTNWKMVSAGCYTTMGIKTDGTLWTWGSGFHGNLGDGGSADKSSPIQTVAGGTNWKQVSSGSFGGIAIYFYDAGDLYPTAY